MMKHVIRRTYNTWEVYYAPVYDVVMSSVNLITPDGEWDHEQYVALEERLQSVRMASFKTRKAARQYVHDCCGVVDREV
jgi:hypothetical protein